MIKFRNQVINKQYSTKDYDALFANPVPGNRDIKLHEVQKQIRSIRKIGQVTNVIISQKGELIDGQHRIKACQSLGIPVNYIITGNKAKAADQISHANSFLNKWTAEKHVNMGAARNTPGFKILKSVIDQNGLNVGIMMALGIGIKHSDDIHHEKNLELIPDNDIHFRGVVASDFKQHFYEAFGNNPRIPTYRAMGRIFNDPNINLSITDWRYINMHIKKVCVNPKLKSQPRSLKTLEENLSFLNAAFNFGKSRIKKNNHILATN